jgi:hypothetical protein
MNHKFTFTHPLALLALLGGMALAACTDDAVPDGGNQNPDAARRGESITLSATLPADLAGARTTITETGTSGNLLKHPLKSAWTPRDAFIVCAKGYNLPDKYLPLDATATAVFTTANGGIPSAAFTGTDITYDGDAPFDCQAIYPAKPIDNVETLEQSYSYSGQVQRGNGDTRHLGDFDYMTANGYKLTSLVGFDFEFKRHSSFFRFVITMPKVDTPVSLNLTAPTEEQAFVADIITGTLTNSLTLAFSDMEKIPKGGQLVAYLAVSPKQLVDTELVLTLTCTDATYTCKAKGHSELASFDPDVDPNPDKRYYAPGRVYDVVIDNNSWQLTTSSYFVYTSAVGTREAPELLDKEQLNSADNPYLIESNSNLHWLVKNVNEGGSFPNGGPSAATAYYRLVKGIQINSPNVPVEWTPIGTADHPFRGHFDGAGHVVTGLLRSSSAPNFGFFGCVSSVVVSGSSPLPDIRNLTVMADVESNISSQWAHRYVGSIVGYTMGSITLDNCHFGGHLTAKGTAGNYSYVGGIAGAVGVGNEQRSSDVSLISGCTTTSAATVGVDDGISISAGNWVCVGGIAGECINAATVSGCTNSATVSGPIITSGDTQSGQITSFYTGGIAGYMKETSLGTGSIYRCTNNGAVTGGVYPDGFIKTGGIAGYLNTTSASDLTNRGAVAVATGAESNSSRTGGIVGHLFMLGGMEQTVGPVSLIYATNEGPVSGGAATQTSYTGGIVGDNSDARAIHLCHNAGNVQSASGNNNAQYFGIGAWIGCNNMATSALYDCCTLAPSVTVDGAPADPQTNGIGTAIAGSSTQPQPCTEGHRGDMQVP